MRPSVRRLLWLVLAVLALAVAGNLSPVLDWLVGRPDPSPVVSLAARDWQDMEANLDLAEDSLFLLGRWSGVLPAEQVDPITFLLDRSLRVTSVTVDGVQCEEQAPLAADLIAQPRHLRVHPVPDSFQPEGELVRVEIRFRGQALSVAADRGRSGPPVVFSGDRPYLPWVGTSSFTTSLVLQTPRGWPVATAVPMVKVDNQHRDEWQLTCGDTLPTFVLGPLQQQTVEVPGRKLQVHSDLPVDQEQAAGALEWVLELLPDRLPEQLDLVLVDGLPPQAEGHMGGDWWILAAPRVRAEWVRVLGRVIQDRDPRSLPAPLQELPEVLAVLSLPLEPAEQLADYRRHHFQGRQAHRLEAWLGLRRLQPGLDLAGVLRRWFLDGTESEDWEGLLQDPVAAAIARWIAGGVDIRLRDLEVRVTGNRFELSGRLHVQPAPPADLVEEVEVLLVSEKRHESFYVDTSGEWTTFRESRLIDRPTRVVLDPLGNHPDQDRHDNAVSLSQRMNPSAFAVTEDSTQLAVVPERNHLTWPYGVYLFDLSVEERSEPRWMEVPGRVVDMRWVEKDRVLLLDLEQAGRGRFQALLDWDGGRTRQFDVQADPAPGGSLILLQEERLPGRYRHAFYRIGTRREVPFLNDHPGRLRWTGNANLLVAEQDDGTGVLFATDGSLHTNLGGPFSGREVRLTPFGTTFVTDGAWHSELHLVDREERMRVLFPSAEEAPAGRILSYFLAQDEGAFLAYLELPDNGGFRVVSFSQSGSSRMLYEGPWRPLAQLHLTRGVILVQPSGSPLGEEEGIVRLSIHDYDQEGGGADEVRVLCEGAHLVPAPVLSSNDRYLYYIRSHPTPETAPARDRPRALYRFDFLNDREEALFTPRG